MGCCVTRNGKHTLSGPSLSKEQRTLGALDFQLYNYSQVERTAGPWGRREATQAVTQFVKSNLSCRQGPVVSSAGLGAHRRGLAAGLELLVLPPRVLVPHLGRAPGSWRGDRGDSVLPAGPPFPHFRGHWPGLVVGEHVGGPSPECPQALSLSEDKELAPQASKEPRPDPPPGGLSLTVELESQESQVPTRMGVWIPVLLLQG